MRCLGWRCWCARWQRGDAAGPRRLYGWPLEFPNTAVTVRRVDGEVVTTDGPFAETKEQLGGFILIEARDLNEAIQAASRIPLARRGSIEVRPIMELKPSARRIR